MDSYGSLGPEANCILLGNLDSQGLGLWLYALRPSGQESFMPRGLGLRWGVGHLEATMTFDKRAVLCWQFT